MCVLLLLRTTVQCRMYIQKKCSASDARKCDDKASVVITRSMVKQVFKRDDNVEVRCTGSCLPTQGVVASTGQQ